MDEKKIIYEIIKDIWDLTKSYILDEMSDDDWEVLIDKASSKYEKYQKEDEKIQMLYREMFMAIQNYGERKCK